jgi:hypothetical protein
MSRPRALLAIVFVCLSLGALAAPLPGVEQFFRAPDMSGAELSPNGRLLALRIGGPGKRPVLAVLDLASMKKSSAACMCIPPAPSRRNGCRWA